MRRTIGMGAAATLVLLQLAGLAVWRVEPAIYLAPIDGPELADDQRA